MAAITSSPARAAQSGTGRDYYELRQFIIENETQKKKLDSFLKEAAIPALNRLGLKPVGVFYPAEGISPVYVLLRFKSLETVATLNADLGADGDFLAAGAELINAPADAPAFKRMESSLMGAFAGMLPLAYSAGDRGGRL